MATRTGARWALLSPYLDQALDLAVEDRGPWLAGLRERDPSLAEELSRLLADRDDLQRDGFLERAPVVVPPPSLAGLEVGAYTLVSPLGAGGMGTVWLAERTDGRFARKAAVKLLNAALVGQGGEERFRHEGRLLGRLTHPNIAHLIDAGVSATGQPYLVLELVEGQHIDQYCDRAALDTEARVLLFLDVLEAVAHAHANLIVHRDLKPSNVLVRDDGVVKLLDFGIAKLLEDEGGTQPALTREGVRPLTPEYAAPEQVTGGPITTATDVHALGVLLYVLLGGPHPAAGTGGAPADLMRAIVETEPPLLSQVAPGGKALRGDLENIVAKALKKRPGERYGSVTAFADDLRRYLRGEPVSAQADTWAYRATRFLYRRARPVGAAVGVVLVVAALTAYYAVRLASERDHARIEAMKAARMSELVTSLLTGADPYATRDREPTVRNILDAGAERVRQELADQPELKAEMLTVIGRVYQRIGLLDTARPLLEEAVATNRASAGGAATAALAQSLNDLGVLVRERGDAPGAVPFLEESLSMRRAVLGAMDKDVAVTLVELGRAFEDQGLLDRAEPLFREALAIRLAIFGSEHRETSTSKASLALVLLRRGDLAGAEPLFREALATSRAVLGEDHPNTGAGWNNLGLLLIGKGEAAEAEPMVRRALAIRERHFGAGHASVANNRANLGAALIEQGRHDEAAAILRAGLDIVRGAGEGDDAAVARLSFQMARVHLARGEAAEAEALLRDTLRRQLRTLPASDWLVAATKSALGAALTGRGPVDEAGRWLAEAQAVLRDVPGREGREAAATRERLQALGQGRQARRD